MKKYCLLLISLLLLSVAGIAQDTTANGDWKLYPSKSDSAKLLDTVYALKKAPTPGKVKVDKDKRLDKVSEDLAGGVTKKPIIRGYRVQVISSSTKSVVDGERGKLMTSFPNCKTYIDYKQPNFRLRAGNFRTRLDAERFQNEIKKLFPNTLVITDFIEYPNLEQ